MKESFLYRTLCIVPKFVGRHFPKLMTQARFLARFHRLCDLQQPKDLNEKIQWLKFNSDLSVWTRLADKYAVRAFVEERGCADTLIPLLGKWDKAEDMDFTALDTPFILKPNNGSGSVIVVKYKRDVDMPLLKKKFHRWLSESYGELEAGIQYYDIPPCVIAERLLENDALSQQYSHSIIDYKIWCCNGEPEAILVLTDRVGARVGMMTYDLNWNAHPEWGHYSGPHLEGRIIPRPAELDQLLDVARKLAKSFPCVRVDLYLVNGKVYFGEMTFTSLGGMMDYYTPAFLRMMGDKVKLPIVY